MLDKQMREPFRVKPRGAWDELCVFCESIHDY